jgi:hypothetical protein
MNSLTRTEAAAIARGLTGRKQVNLGTPHATVCGACNAIREMYMPGHHDFSQVLAVFASKLKDSGFLSEKVKRSVIEQLDELADEIDQDLVNQKEGDV